MNTHLFPLIHVFLTNQTKMVMFLEVMLIIHIIAILYLTSPKRLKLNETDLREIDPVNYYQNNAPMQTELTNLWTLALCTNPTDNNPNLSILYLEEVFTSSDAVNKLADKLNEDLKKKNISSKYWTPILYENPTLMSTKEKEHLE